MWNYLIPRKLYYGLSCGILSTEPAYCIIKLPLIFLWAVIKEILKCCEISGEKNIVLQYWCDTFLTNITILIYIDNKFRYRSISHARYICIHSPPWPLNLWLFQSNELKRDVYTAIRVLYQLDENGNDTNIGIKGFTMWKQKKISNKMLPQWVLIPWTSDSKSNTLLSELIWHVLLLFMQHLVFGLRRFSFSLTSQFQVSLESRMLDLESEVHGFSTYWE